MAKLGKWEGNDEFDEDFEGFKNHQGLLITSATKFLSLRHEFLR
jgi:hypothetical protein